MSSLMPLPWPLLMNDKWQWCRFENCRCRVRRNQWYAHLTSSIIHHHQRFELKNYATVNLCTVDMFVSIINFIKTVIYVSQLLQFGLIIYTLLKIAILTISRASVAQNDAGFLEIPLHTRKGVALCRSTSGNDVSWHDIRFPEAL